MPDARALCGDSEASTAYESASIFVALLELTEVLGRVLEFTYDVSNPSKSNRDSVSTFFESLMDSWQDSQDDFIQRIVCRGTDLPVPGAANLRLAYLGLKFLTARLNSSLSNQEPRQNEETSSLHRIHIRRAAKEIFHFVKELNQAQLQGFWLPMHAYTLTSATSFLIRDALRPDDKNASQSRRIVPEMVSILRRYQNDYNWDLAENTLASYGPVVDQLEFEVVGTGAAPANVDIPCLSLPDMEEVFINLDDYVQLEPEDFMPNFSFQVDEQLTLIAPPRTEIDNQINMATYQMQ